MIRSAKAAKREFLRKDPWWKIYERVFTSEAVYLPNYGDVSPRDRVSDSAASVDSEAMPHHVARARQGAIRWAMTQLIGKAKRIGIRDSHFNLLAAYVSVDPGRLVVELSGDGQQEERAFDLVMSVPTCVGPIEMLEEIKLCAASAPRTVFAFHSETSPLRTSAEIYWLLKSFYDEVSVLKMPDPVVPWLEPISSNFDKNPLIAWAFFR